MPTLRDTVNDYIEHLHESGASPSHRRTVRWRLGQFLQMQQGKIINGDRLIGFVTRQDLAEHLEAMEARGYEEGTMAGLVSTHKAFWRWALEGAYTRMNIADKLSRRSFAPQKRRPAPAADVAAVVAVLEEYSRFNNQNWVCLRDATIVSLSLDSGARRRALRNLKVDAVRAALRAPETTPAGPAYMAYSFSKRKVAKLRFFEETARFFRRLLPLLPEGATYAFLSIDTEDRLHPDSLGGPFERICEYAGVPTFRSHAIRKRNTIEVAREDGPRAAQEYAGHSDISVTQTHYLMPEENAARDAAAAINARRRGNGPAPESPADDPLERLAQLQVEVEALMVQMSAKKGSNNGSHRVDHPNGEKRS